MENRYPPHNTTILISATSPSFAVQPQADPGWEEFCGAGARKRRTAQRQRTIPAAHAGRYKRVVIFDNNARPRVIPRSAVLQRSGFCIQLAKASRAANWVQ